MRSRELLGTTFALRFPDNNCTPQNVRQPIRFKYSTARSIIFFFNFKRSKMYKCGFNNQMHLHIKDHLLKWFERSDLYYKTHEVTRCKQPLYFFYGIFH